MIRFREIERLRGLAILLAVSNHWPLHPLVAWFTGVVGVHLFFVISGFVITLSLTRLRDTHPHPLRAFYLRRLFRLAPMAALSILMGLAASLWFNQASYWSEPPKLLREALAIVTLTFNYRVFDLGWDYVYFWSLNIEEQFYLVLPLVLVVLAVRRDWSPTALLKGFSLAWVAAVCVRLATDAQTQDPIPFWRAHFSTHTRVDLLLAGVVLGLIHQARLFERPSASRELRVALRGVAAVAVVGLIEPQILFGWFSNLNWSLVELAAITLVALASFRRGYVLPVPVLGPALELLGARAYTIYLLHMGLGRLMAEALSRHLQVNEALGTWGRNLTYVVTVLILSELAFRFIERPLTELGRRLSSARAGDPVESQLVKAA